MTGSKNCDSANLAQDAYGSEVDGREPPLPPYRPAGQATERRKLAWAFATLSASPKRGQG